LAEAAALPNIFAKASEILRSERGRILLHPSAYRPGLDALFQLFGPNRVMYGSNWPMPSGATTYGTLHQLAADYVLALGPERAAQFFWRNSVAAYQLDPERVRLRGFALGSAAESGGQG
jgi:L-fuconolactonase